jgi:PAS domain S-box-containing protein
MGGEKVTYAMIRAELARVLTDQDRLDALHRLQILDTPPEPQFDRITRLAQAISGSAASLLSFIAADRHFYKSAVGLSEYWASNPDIPLSHSYSKFVIATGEPLIICDAREHPLTQNNPAIEDLGAVAYLGQPLITREGHVVGSLCITDHQPRNWTRSNLQILEDVAALAMTELEMREAAALQMRVETALRETEGRFRELTDNLRHVFWLRALDGEGMLYVSPAYETLFAQSREELYQDARAFLKAIHTEDRDRVIEQIRAIDRAGFADEYRVVHPNGEVRWVRANAFPVEDATGSPYRIAGILEDITEQREAEEALRLSESRLEAAQRIAHIGHWDWDIRTNDLYWSREIYRIFGLEPEIFESSYPAFLERIHPDDRERVAAAVEDAVVHGSPYSIDHRIVRPDGSVRYVHEEGELSRTPSGTPVRMLGTVQDITDRKHLEEQLRQSQKMDAVGRLAGGVAHDFNNVLTAIVGNAILLLDDLEENSPIRSDLEEILRSAERGATLTQQLLLFSRSETPAVTNVDLNEVVRDLERMLRRLIGEDVALSTYLDPALGHIRADQGRLEQLVLNLVVNARDAMPMGGGVRIETRSVELSDEHVRRTLVPRQGRYVQLRVSDTGCGIDREMISKIFEPFFTTKARGEGTGLGLSTVYSIVKQNAGGIQVESEVGHGTTFEIYLPQSGEGIRQPDNALPTTN